MLTRPVPIATVLEALPKACKRDAVLCRQVRSYLDRYFGQSGVTEASIPGRCAAPPAPAMITRNPRLSAEEPYSIMSRGIRCADTTSAS